VIIYFGSVYENEMQDFINDKLGVEIQFVADWSATLAMTVVNYVVPYFIGILSELQQWDFAEEFLYDSLLKNYYTSMINIIVFLIL
jgi:hypothetical protein